MINLFYDDENNVGLIYYADLPEELQKKKHLEVESLEVAEVIEGKEAVLKADATHYWYEYVDKELTEEELRELRLSDLEIAIASMVGGEI